MAEEATPPGSIRQRSANCEPAAECGDRGVLDRDDGFGGQDADMFTSQNLCVRGLGR